MVSTFPGPSGQVFQGWIAHSQPLTTPQQTALTTALTGAKYKDSAGASLHALDIYALLNNGSTAHNTAAQTHVPVTAMPRETFLHVIADLLFAVSALPDNNAYKAPIIAAWAGYAPIATSVISVDFSGAAVTGIMGLVVASGVATQQQIDAFAKMPDPSYQAILPVPSDASVILGVAGVIEIADIATSLAAH